MVGEKQLTVAWRMDDLRVLHMDASVVEKSIQELEQEFSKETPLSISHRKVHNYLGMT